VVTLPISKVCPSGSADAAARVPIAPLAPGLLSTTTCRPRVDESHCATRRPMTSIGPPAANGTISLIGLLG
jgi:hypothetical protein